MRRLLAIAVIAIISLLMVLPLVFAQPGSASLPPCCRAKGVHHCSVGQAAANNAGTGMQSDSQTCPLYPHIPVLQLPVVLALIAACTLYFGRVTAQRFRFFISNIFVTPLFGMAVPKRGPPVCFA